MLKNIFSQLHTFLLWLLFSVMFWGWIFTLFTDVPAARMELAVIGVSTLAGWIVIYCGMFTVAAARRELAHANMLHREARETVRGAVSVTDERVTIRQSITARRVEVAADGQTRRLLVCEARAAALAAAGASVLYTVHGYVAAYEVTP